jgi:hypothetical protein
LQGRPWGASDALADLLSLQAKAIGPTNVVSQIRYPKDKPDKPWKTRVAELIAAPTAEQFRGEAGVSDGLMAVYKVTTPLSQELIGRDVDCVVRNVKPLGDLTPQEMNGLLERVKPLVAKLGFKQPPRAAFVESWGDSWSKLIRARHQLGMHKVNGSQVLSNAMGVKLERVAVRGGQLARAALRVRVLGTDGKSINNATVKMVFPPEASELFKDYHLGFQQEKDGSWFCARLPDDEEFTLAVAAPGYDQQSQKLKVPLRDSKELEVKLKAAAKATEPADKTSPAKPADGAPPGKEKHSAERSAAEWPPGYLPLLTLKYEKLTRINIRRRYGIDDDQEKKLRDLAAKYEPFLAEQRTAFKELEKLPPQQRKAKRAELFAKQAQVANIVRKAIEETLTEMQRAEFHLDELRDLGISLCTNLNDEGKYYGLDISSRQRQQLDQLFIDLAHATKQGERDEGQRLLAVLTTEQRERLSARFPDAQLTAPHIYFPPPELARLPQTKNIVPLPLTFGFRSHGRVDLTAYGGLWDEGLRKQMALSPEQIWKLEAIEAKSATAAQQIFDFFEPKATPRKLSADEQKARDAKYRQELETLGKDIHREIDEMLTPAQRRLLIGRFKEAHGVTELIGAVRNSKDALFEDLHASAEQRAAIRQICGEAAVRHLVPDRATGEKALAILTPEQRKKLEEAIERQGW